MNNLITVLLLFFAPLTMMAQQSIQGNINMPNGNGVCDVLVELRNTSNEVVGQAISDITGSFTLGNNLTIGADYSLFFSREENFLNGASTFDLVMLFRIILGIDTPSTYALWAADVNGSGQMTTLDMVLIRRLILAIDEELPVPNWAFDEPNVLVPDNTVEIISFNGNENISIIGVKRGDLNNSANSGCQ